MTGSPALHRRSQLGWGLLIACLAVETLLLAWVTLFTLLAALGSSAGVAQNYSLVVVAAICLDVYKRQAALRSPFADFAVREIWR